MSTLLTQEKSVMVKCPMYVNHHIETEEKLAVMGLGIPVIGIRYRWLEFIGNVDPDFYALVSIPPKLEACTLEVGNFNLRKEAREHDIRAELCEACSAEALLSAVLMLTQADDHGILLANGFVNICFVESELGPCTICLGYCKELGGNMRWRLVGHKPSQDMLWPTDIQFLTVKHVASA